MSSTDTDIAILGGGCAGLSIAGGPIPFRWHIKQRADHDSHRASHTYAIAIKLCIIGDAGRARVTGGGADKIGKGIQASGITREQRARLHDQQVGRIL